MSSTKAAAQIILADDKSNETPINTVFYQRKSAFARSARSASSACYSFSLYLHPNLLPQAG